MLHPRYGMRIDEVFAGFMEKLKKMLRRALRSRGLRISRLDDCGALPFLLRALLAKQPRLSFIEIGANDGVTSDPLYEFVTENHTRVNGLVVEPVREYFEQLVRNYRDYPSIVAVNKAIHRTEKTMVIHRVTTNKQASVARWTRGAASFDSENLERAGVPTSALSHETVECMTLDELVLKHGIVEIDVLQIDAEGYDAEIIRGIDFRRLKPKIIRFEHGRLKNKMDPATFVEIRRLLHEQDYEMMVEMFDVTAYLPSVVLTLAVARTGAAGGS